MKTRIAVLAAASFLMPSPIIAKSLRDLSYPVFVCIKFDQAGNVTEAAIDGNTDDSALNVDMVRLLRSARWHFPGSPGWVPQYVTATGESAGAPVPEQPFKCPP